MILRADETADKLFIDRIGDLKIASTYMKVFYSKGPPIICLITISVVASFGMRFTLKNLIKR